VRLTQVRRCTQRHVLITQELSQCDSSCLINQSILKCQNSVNPSCITPTWSISGHPFSFFVCETGGTYTGYGISITYAGYSTPIPLPILVDNSGNIQRETVYPSTISSTSPISSLTGTSGSSSTTTTTSTTSAQATTSEPINVGAIAGGVVAAVFLLCAAAVFVVFIRRRRSPNITSGDTSAVGGVTGTKPELDATQSPRTGQHSELETGHGKLVTQRPELEAVQPSTAHEMPTRRYD